MTRIVSWFISAACWLVIAGLALCHPVPPAGEHQLQFYNQEYDPGAELDTMRFLIKELSRRVLQALLSDLAMQRAIENYTGFADNKMLCRPRI